MRERSPAPFLTGFLIFRRPLRDESWRASLRIALDAFKRAKQVLPEEWSFPYYIGKVRAGQAASLRCLRKLLECIS